MDWPLQYRPNQTNSVQQLASSSSEVDQALEDAGGIFVVVCGRPGSEGQERPGGSLASGVGQLPANDELILINHDTSVHSGRW